MIPVIDRINLRRSADCVTDKIFPITNISFCKKKDTCNRPVSNHMLWMRDNGHALRCISMVPQETHKVPLSLIASFSLRLAVNLGQTQAPLLHTMVYTLFSSRLCDNYCLHKILIHYLIFKENCR